ncbi:MAG: hypothetical protein P8R02_03770 [Pseudomonadales bacterium]|nr:hypothetical protein [Pseudomonadales bacterium]
MLNDYYYDERNNLLVMEHVGDYVGAEFQTVVPELLEKVQGQVNYIIIDMSKVTSATIIDTDLALVNLTHHKITKLGFDLDIVLICAIIPQDAPQNLIQRSERFTTRSNYIKYIRSVSWEAAFVEMDLEHFFSYPFSIKTQSE